MQSGVTTRLFVLDGADVTYNDLEKILDMNPNAIRKRIIRRVGPTSTWPTEPLPIDRSWFQGSVKRVQTSRRSDALARIFKDYLT